MNTILIIALLFLPFRNVYSQRPVILTENAATLGFNQLEAGIGVEYFSKSDESLIELPTSEVRLGVCALRFGVAENVNFDLEWRGRLLAEMQSGESAADWGDLTVATKITILRERTNTPVLGLRSAVKLPNTSYRPYKLGSDQTDYFFHILLTKQIINIETRMNIGFGIVGNPRATASQDDIYILSGASIIPFLTNSRLFVELYGFTGSFEDDDKLLGRFGVTLHQFNLSWNIFGSVRLSGNNKDFGAAFEASEDWSIGFFLAKQIRF
ncbi:MAG: transporter [Ignavibacteriae bacterium]|nr:transporter [Ignavibacteriota bacterium]